MPLSPKQEELCQQSRWDFTDLRALFINCTLKRSPELSHTQGLADLSMEIMRRQGVTVEVVRAVDRQIATGVWPDMTEHGEILVGSQNRADLLEARLRHCSFGASIC